MNYADINTKNLHKNDYTMGIIDLENIEDLNLYDKPLAYQLGLIHSIIENTDAFAGINNDCLIKGIFKDHKHIFEQIQVILSSINIYSELIDYGNMTFLKIYDLDILMTKFGFNIELQEILKNIKKTNTTELKKYQKIKSISMSLKIYNTYDIQVPIKNHFVSSGVITHNCGEQWLPPYGNCLLSALVLHKYVINPYSKDAEFDIISFLEDVKNTVKFLDLMIDINKKLHPLKEQRDTDEYGRRIGIEVTGLHDMLAMLNIDYGSDECIDKIEDIFKKKAIEELQASIDLAKEKGCAPCFKSKRSRELFIEQDYIQRLLKTLLKTNMEKTINNILEYGLRNSAFNTIGPCGSISLIADNCTSGIEPIFEIEYFRESRLSENKIRMIHLPLVKHIGEKVFDYNKEELKKKFKYNIAHEIDYNKRIKVQSELQKWIDSSISSTINLKNESTIEDIFNIYLLSWKNKLKGVTVFRDGSKKGVLELIDNKKEDNKELINEELVIKHLEFEKNELDKTLRGYRYIKKWKGVKVYITVTINNDGKIREIFSTVPWDAGLSRNNIYSVESFMEKKAYWDAICRNVSLLLRLNVPIDVIIKQLEKSSPTMTELPNIIAGILKNYISYTEEQIENIKAEKEFGEFCNECKKHGMIYSGGCSVCVFCNNTTCG